MKALLPQQHFEVDGLVYSGLSWGDPSLPVALALHGWMDNAASFSQLGPRLKNRQLIALDLSGHGLSGRRSADATYQIWDDIPQLVGIIDQLGCTKVSLIGHSRGAAIAALLAVVLGERCDHLVMIDGLLPAAIEAEDAPRQLARFVHERQKYAARSDRYFDSLEAFVEKRAQYGFSKENGRVFAERSLEKTAHGFRMRNDPRLFGASAVKLDPIMCVQFYRSITAPTLFIMGDDGFFKNEPGQRMRDDVASEILNFRSATLPGGHHLHLEDAAELVALRINTFLETSQ